MGQKCIIVTSFLDGALAEELATNINAALKDGWLLNGQPFAFADMYRPALGQMMVKKEED